MKIKENRRKFDRKLLTHSLNCVYILAKAHIFYICFFEKLNYFVFTLLSSNRLDILLYHVLTSAHRNETTLSMSVLFFHTD